MNSTATINVAFAINNDFIPHCAVTIASILFANHTNDDYHFFILTSDISQANKTKFKIFAKQKNFNISFIHVDNLIFEKKYLPKNCHYTIETFYRLKIPSLLRAINKVIYLDSDILVLQNLANLWHTNLAHQPIGAVESCRTLQTSEQPATKTSKPNHYFNSGILLMDLKLSRQKRVESKFIHFLKITKNELRDADQDVINEVLRDQISVLDDRWNTQIRFDIPMRAEYRLIQQNPFILHFLTADKPWKTETNHPYSHLYQFFERQTPWWSEIEKSPNKNRKVVYTCVTGTYDEVINHTYHNPDWDYVCFTDSPEIINPQNSQWSFRPLVFSKLDDVRNQRWHKVHAHELFPDYEISLWIDANLDILKPDVFNDVTKAINDKQIFAAAPHFSRDCIYDEWVACQKLKKDDPQIMRSQIELIRKDHYPAHYGLFETNLIYRKHHDKKLVAAMLEWWWWLQNYSKRDQLSLNYVLWKCGIRSVALSKKSYRNNDGRVAFRVHYVKLNMTSNELRPPTNEAALITEQAQLKKTENMLARQINDLENQLNQIKSAKFYRIWQFWKQLKVIFKLKSR